MHPKNKLEFEEIIYKELPEKLKNNDSKMKLVIIENLDQLCLDFF